MQISCVKILEKESQRQTDRQTERGRKEGNVLCNDALNTFGLRLCGVRHMVKDHLDSERGNPLLPHGFFYIHHPTDRITHTTTFDPMTHCTISEHSNHGATSHT